MLKRAGYILFALVLVIMPILFNAGIANADISYCFATVDPHEVLTNSSTDFHFQLDNDDTAGNSIQWFRVPLLPGYFTVSSASAPGWTTNITADEILFTGGSLAPNSSLTFTITAQAAGNSSPPVYWNVQVADNPDATNPSYCDGDTSVTINQPPPVNISNVHLTNLSAHSVTVLWNTDLPSSSAVFFGTTSDYGTQSAGDNNVTSHSVVLNNLSANTGYHYKVSSTDGNGNTAESDDSTFLTPLEPTPTPTPAPVPVPPPAITTPQTTIPTTTTPTVLPTPKSVDSVAPVITDEQKKETVPPTIEFTTKIDKPVNATPTITGTAKDNVSVAKIEYSTDGGKNWLPVDFTKGLGKTSVDFSFAPLQLGDGNYDIVTRATDEAGNKGISTHFTLIVDFLPPQVGGSMVSVGPQQLAPNGDGVVTTVAGVDQRITMSAIGGPTSITLMLNSATNHGGSTFTLTQAVDTGLWSGVVSLTKAGKYKLVAFAVDGAGNQTTRSLGELYALSPSRVLGKKTGQVVKGAKATLYYLQQETNSWQVWDAPAYNQINPQTTTAKGELHYLVPAGKYYLKVEAGGYRLFESQIFETSVPMPITSDVSLKPKIQLSLHGKHLTLPSWVLDQGKVGTTSSSSIISKSPLIGKTAPGFTLFSTSGTTTNAVQFAGKPTVLSFTSSWAPNVSEQLTELAKLQANKDINATPVFIHEGIERVTSVLAVGHYDIKALADPTGATVNAYDFNAMPTNYFLDRHGVVKKVVVGVLSSKEILSTLGGL